MMLLFYGEIKKLEQKKKVACNMAFHCVGQKKKITECIFFSQYPEAGITLMCFLLHVELRGDTIVDSSALSEY